MEQPCPPLGLFPRSRRVGRDLPGGPREIIETTKVDSARSYRHGVAGHASPGTGFARKWVVQPRAAPFDTYEDHANDLSWLDDHGSADLPGLLRAVHLAHGTRTTSRRLVR